jgi:hypothetical protein
MEPETKTFFVQIYLFSMLRVLDQALHYLEDLSIFNYTPVNLLDVP